MVVPNTRRFTAFCYGSGRTGKQSTGKIKESNGESDGSFLVILPVGNETGGHLFFLGEDLLPNLCFLLEESTGICIAGNQTKIEDQKGFSIYDVQSGKRDVRLDDVDDVCHLEETHDSP